MGTNIYSVSTLHVELTGCGHCNHYMRVSIQISNNKEEAIEIHLKNLEGNDYLLGAELEETKIIEIY